MYTHQFCSCCAYRNANKNAKLKKFWFYPLHTVATGYKNIFIAKKKSFALFLGQGNFQRFNSFYSITKFEAQRE